MGILVFEDRNHFWKEVKRVLLLVPALILLNHLTSWSSSGGVDLTILIWLISGFFVGVGVYILLGCIFA